MSVLLVILPLALILAAAAVGAFIWAVRGGQFDDLDSPAQRMVVEDDEDGGAAVNRSASRPADGR